MILRIVRSRALERGLVLDRNGDALEGPEPPVGLHVAGLGGAGLLLGALEIGHGEGVDRRLDRLGPGDQRAHKLDRREPLRLEAGERFGRADVTKFRVRHVQAPS